MCSPGSAEAVTVLVVTGTDTGVGKTVATAALACHARQAGIDVAVCKPVQTGTDDGDDDLAEVARLSGVTELAGLARYPRPLAPVAAAAAAGMALPSREQLLGFIGELDRPGRLTLVEGAGDCWSSSAKTVSPHAISPSRWARRCWSWSGRRWAPSTTPR